MGLLKKGQVVCDPAKKNSTIFQNSFQETYQTGTEQYIVRYDTIPVYDTRTIGWSGYCTNTGQVPIVVSGDFYSAGSGRPTQTNSIDNYTLQPGQSVDFRGGKEDYGNGSYSYTYYTLRKVYVPSTGETFQPGGNIGDRSYTRTVQVGTTQKPVYDTRPTYGTRTAWNTKWRKLDA